ncbi:gibberellin 2-oxidase [Colletotrichum scovillei]|uniref:Gibberellin 2-oxidase n=1 Tax=Colletotrichum scovillei TaxID=1209932 RepID=A0A9P7QVB1_9PEZI|nr:gibberellin 2-oxidase [Colletotrichum scovillei]KAG7041718.1 gibberellin 2-oxidase [Colletotrichum scovillei]
MAPSAVSPPPSNTDKLLVKPWSRPQPTKEDLDWAPLTIIDLSRFDEPGEKQELAKQLYDAISRVGFWVVTGTGIDDERVLRQFSIGNTFFKEPLEEKRTYPCNFAEGEYFGYRENERWLGDTGVKENIEMLNIHKDIPAWKNVGRHRVVEENWDEIRDFHRDVWEVARKLFVLIAIILELPENYLADAHAYDQVSDDHLRYMIYNVRTEEQWDKAQAFSTGGHTDFGSLTLLFSQHVAGLQIRTPEGDWKYVKPVEGGITCNAADTLTFLTNGFIKSTIHRVVKPPKDQINIPRLGLLYFSRPGDHTPMRTLPSPLLDRLGLIREEDRDLSRPVPSGTEYVRARVKDVHHKKVLDKREGTSFQYKGFDNPGEPVPQIHYVWLDVACIDQTRGSAEMALEVGRQAKIFKGATHTFAWLTKLSRQGYLSQTETLQQQAKLSRAEAKNGIERVQRGLDGTRQEIELLGLDPWFSSLWTLQEAYLCPQSVFISRQGELMNSSEIDNPAESPMLLSDFIDYCDHMMTIVTSHEKKPQTIETDDKYLLALKRSVERSGMIGLRSSLPVTLLGAARHRTTTRATDRVYGIMQIFGFQLGKSRPGCDSRVEFSLAELEDELGRELLIREPIMSQMHIFEIPPQPGKRWRISQDSQPTRRLNYGDGKSVFDAMSVKAKLSTVTLKGVNWGHFSGKICKFSKLVEIWNTKAGWTGGNIDLDGPEQWTAIHGPDLAREEAIAFSQQHPDAVLLLLGVTEIKISPKHSSMPMFGYVLGSVNGGQAPIRITVLK